MSCKDCGASFHTHARPLLYVACLPPPHVGEESILHPHIPLSRLGVGSPTLYTPPLPPSHTPFWGGGESDYDSTEPARVSGE